MKKVILILVLLLHSLYSYSQEEEESANTDLYRIAKENAADRITKIGTFTLLQKKTVGDGSSKASIKAKKVELELKNGFIKDIKVVADNGDVFSNNVAISLVKYPDRVNDKLFNTHPDKDHEYILLGDVLKYDCEIGKNYIPDNVDIILPLTKQVKVEKSRSIIDNGDGTKTIKEENLKSINVFKDTLIYTCQIDLNDGISNLIDYRVYSDFLGLIEATTNGIANFEAKVNIPVNPSNFPQSNFYVFKSLMPNVRYSRFDKLDRVVSIDSLALPNYIVSNKIELIQKSYISCGASLELITYNPKNSFIEFSIPFISNFYLAEAIPGIKENLTSVSYGTGLEIKVNRSDNFGITFGGYVHKLRHLYNRRYNLEKIDPFNYFNLNSEVFFYGSKKTDALFLRFNYTSVFADSNNFFQFQIGYKSALNL